VTATPVTRPLIALTSYLEPAKWNVWDKVPAALLPWTYVQQVIDAGGAPILLPPEPSTVRDVMARVDGLLLTGGPDVDPARYGAERDPATQRPRESRDESELLALATAQEMGIPVLAICRGLQLLNVARGGTLHQHLPEHAPKVPGTYDTNKIRITPGTRLAAALGEDATVLCAHHQAIDRAGQGLDVVAWSPDGVIEGVEDPSGPFLVGIQPHPEELSESLPLFEAFVAACRT
jgi:putative glutamine amidotransferase